MQVSKLKSDQFLIESQKIGEILWNGVMVLFNVDVIEFGYVQSN